MSQPDPSKHFLGDDFKSVCDKIMDVTGKPKTVFASDLQLTFPEFDKVYSGREKPRLATIMRLREILDETIGD